MIPAVRRPRKLNSALWPCGQFSGSLPASSFTMFSFSWMLEMALPRAAASMVCWLSETVKCMVLTSFDTRARCSKELGAVSSTSTYRNLVMVLNQGSHSWSPYLRDLSLSSAESSLLEAVVLFNFPVHKTIIERRLGDLVRL